MFEVQNSVVSLEIHRFYRLLIRLSFRFASLHIFEAVEVLHNQAGLETLVELNVGEGGGCIFKHVHLRLQRKDEDFHWIPSLALLVSSGTFKSSSLEAPSATRSTFVDCSFPSPQTSQTAFQRQRSSRQSKHNHTNSVTMEIIGGFKAVRARLLFLYDFNESMKWFLEWEWFGRTFSLLSILFYFF